MNYKIIDDEPEGEHPLLKKPKKPFAEMTYDQQSRRSAKLLRQGKLRDDPEVETWAIEHHQVPKDYV